MKIIRQYTNGKFYDTELSSYITLFDIYKYVTADIEFRVIRSKWVDVTISTTNLALINYLANCLGGK